MAAFHFDVAMLAVYQFENRCLIDHLIKLTAIYKSGVEYEQGMRKRPPSKFGVALVQEYRKRGLTQYSLAQKLGRSTRYLNNLEHDRNEPRFTTILLLADAIGMEQGELVDAAAALSWAALTEEEAVLENTEGDAEKDPEGQVDKRK